MRQLLFVLVACVSLAHAQETNSLDSLLNQSAFSEESELQKKLNQATTVASGKALTTRETPGILSVITSEDIMKSGARDISDVLRLVPGFEVMQDVQFVTGVGFRGNWANEGKVLFLLDGHPVNELLYQTVPLLNNFMVDAIEKIEIIRGPGSAIYGGSAEYAVINIITKAASSLSGVAVHSTGGFHQSAIGRMNGGLMAAQQGEKFSWDLSAARNTGIVSDQRYNDLTNSFPEPVDLAKVTHADATQISAGLRAGGLSLRGTYIGYRTNDPAYFVEHDNYSVDARYDLKINEKLTVTPQYIYFNQIPWAYGNESDGSYVIRSKATRQHIGTTFNQRVGRKLNLTYGWVFFRDKAVSKIDPTAYEGGSLTMTNYAFFTQGLYRHRLFNVTAGFRYEKNSRAGDAFVPRLAITKKIENFHFKALYSQAFRTPAIQNVSAAINGIVPERSQVAELELGYQFTPDMLLAVNAYHIETRNVIVYNYDAVQDVESYSNFKETGSNGLEAIYSYNKNKWNVRLTYALALAQKTDSSTYYAPQSKTQYLGFSKHVFTLVSTIDITSKISLNTSVISGSKRYAYTSVDSNELPVSAELPAYALVNSFLNFQKIWGGLNAGIGVCDIFNSRPGLAQPYNGDYAPVPGRSRELVIKLSYQFNFKK